MKSYSLKYSESFASSLETLISDWEDYFDFPGEKISTFLATIRESLNLCSFSPEMYQDVTEFYQFEIPTRRILIGQQYAIFYRIDEKNKIIQVGAIVSQKQMKVKF